MLLCALLLVSGTWFHICGNVLWICCVKRIWIYVYIYICTCCWMLYMLKDMKVLWIMKSVQLIWLWIHDECYNMMEVPVVMCRTWKGNIDVSQYYCYLVYVWMIITLLTWLIDMNRYDIMCHVLHDRKKYEHDMICITCMKEVE